MSNVFQVFGADRKKEVEGVTFEYPGNIRVKLARAGGGNTAFSKAHEIRYRPYRTSAKVQALDEATQRKVIIAVYLDSVIRGFETNLAEAGEEPNWQPVIQMPSGTVEATRPALEQLLEMLPDLLNQIIADSTDLANYRKAELEREAGN